MHDITRFKLSAEQIQFVGRDLSRPECVIAEPDGTLWVSDNRASVTRIDPDGAQERLGAAGGVANGLAMDRQGRIYVADIDGERVYRLLRDGRHEVVLDAFEGGRLGAVNFVYLDSLDRLWVTVSTRTQPRKLAVERPIPDGYILVVDGDGPRKVADGLCFTNEIRIDAEGRFVYIAETARGHVSRQAIHPDGSLGPREVYGPSPVAPGARIDGIAFDSAGNLWVTEITRNGLVVITPEGTAHKVFEDPAGLTLNFPTSIAFGGPDRRTAYIGSLNMDRLACFEAPVPGEPLRHWNRD
jgi:gluconolactonase